MAIDLRTIALGIIDRNPNIANDPRNAEMIATLRSNDNRRGEDLARQLCTKNGTTPDAAVKDARNFFHI